MRPSSWLLILAVPGCDVILGADDYRRGADPPPSGSIYTPECKACVEDRCAAVVRPCERDQTCGDLLRCVQTCRDPGCVLRCAAPTHGPLLDWPIEDVEDCLVSKCWDTCPIGRDFACRDYSWPAIYQADETVSIDVKVFDLSVGLAAGVAGVEVTPCVGSLANEICNDGATGITDDAGFTTIDVPMSPIGFTGSLRAFDPDTPAVGYRAYRDHPFTTYWDLNYVSIDSVGFGRAFYSGQTQKEFDENVGGVQLELYDCNTWPAGGLVVTKPSADADYWIYYPSGKGRTVGEGERDDDGEPIEDNLNMVFIVGPPGEIDVEIRTVDGAPFRHTELTLHPGRLDLHMLFPRVP